MIAYRIKRPRPHAVGPLPAPPRPHLGERLQSWGDGRAFDLIALALIAVGMWALLR